MSLKKISLYVLKQTSKMWCSKLVHELLQPGIKDSKNDYSPKNKDNLITLTIVYVDDIILIENDLKAFIISCLTLCYF